MKRYLINVLATQDLNEIADYFTTNNIHWCSCYDIVPNNYELK